MNTRYLGAALAAVWICACDSDERRPTSDAAASASVRQESASASSQPLATAAVPEPCDLIPRAEIERLAGPLEGEPRREGNGCWFYVAVDTTSAEWRQLRERAERARAGGMDERAIDLYHPTRAGVYAEVYLEAAGERSDTAPPGWDEARMSRTGAIFNGRTGHLKVTVRLQQLRLSADTVAAIAGRVRDRIPDAPIPHPAADRSGRSPPGPHPCSVLTREEAETGLGKLVMAPFRTREGTPLADPSGTSCAYLTPGHHVLVLTPRWNYGAIDLKAARMVGGLVSQVADLRGIEGDTLEGPWDEAVVDLEGALLLRKGGRVLGIDYRASPTDAAGALRLAVPALGRLAAEGITP